MRSQPIYRRGFAFLFAAGLLFSNAAAFPAAALEITTTQTAPTATPEQATPETAAATSAPFEMYSAALDDASADVVFAAEPQSSINYTLGDASCDIPRSSFVPEDNCYYGTATFYDYYGDYERAGNKLRDLADISPADAKEKLREAGARNGSDGRNNQSAVYWNLALSAYFDDAPLDPLYFGDATFFKVGSGSNLPGSLHNFTPQRTYGNDKCGANPSYFNREQKDAYFPTQGIAADALGADGQLMLKANKGDADTPAIEAPYFNREFIRNANNPAGPNGQVYENVSFPFIWNAGTSTWLFDSEKSGAELKQDAKSSAYFLARNDHPANYRGSKGFFPFNAQGLFAKDDEAYKLNYMFGMQLELPFNLTADKRSDVIDSDGAAHKVDTVFRFAGDDDIWIYIDGKLVLDMGGSHGVVAGAIDFKNDTYVISGTWDGINGHRAAAMNSQTLWEETAQGIGEDFTTGKYSAYCTVGSLSQKLGEELTTGERHTIQIFYLERGWAESNLKMSFNFQQNSIVDISKSVDIFNVSETWFDTETRDALQAQLDEELYTFQVKSQKNAANTGLQPADGKSYTLLSDGTAHTVEQDGILKLKANQTARFVNEFAYDSYLQVRELSGDDTRFEPRWTLKEICSDGMLQDITKAQANIDPASSDLLEDMPGSTPYDKRPPSDGSSDSRPQDTESLWLHPFNTEDKTDSENVRLQIKYTNVLRTSSLTLCKQLADGSAPESGSFTLLVAFDRIAGTEVSHTVSVVLDAKNGYTQTLTGIPYGTTYSIYEVAQDGWKLANILPACSENTQLQQNGQTVYSLCYTGEIAENAQTETVTFQNSVVPAPTQTPAVTLAPTAAPTATPGSTDSPASSISAPTTSPTPGKEAAATASPAPTQTPAATTSTIPQTGDAFPAVVLIAVALCSAAVLLGLPYNRKKKS